MERQIRFCKTVNGASIAYAIQGQGPTVVTVPGWISHLQLYAEFPTMLDAFTGKLSHHHTMVDYDKYGCGLSERSRTDFSFESELQSLEAVVDHLKLKHFALFGWSQGGPVAIAYAVKYPRRVSHLMLYGTYARGEAITTNEFKGAVKSLIKAHWGMGSKILVDLFIPGADETSSRWFTRLQREAATPAWRAMWPWSQGAGDGPAKIVVGWPARRSWARATEWKVPAVGAPDGEPSWCRRDRGSSRVNVTRGGGPGRRRGAAGTAKRCGA